jgi:PAS domain S-box-containing protein
MRRFLQSSFGKYVIALVGVAAALALQQVLTPWIGSGGATIAVSAVLIIALGGAMHSARRRAEGEAGAARRHAGDLEKEIEDHRLTRASLEAKERDLQIVTDTMTAAVARCSHDLRYLWVNRLYAEWAGNGKKPEEMMGRPMVEILGVEAMERIRPHIEQVLAGRRVEYERFARRPGGRRWINASLDPTFDGAGAPSGWVAVIHDIDERKRASESLRDAREQLQVVTDTVPAAVLRTGNDLRYQWMNPVAARWLGKPAHQLVGRIMADVLGAEQMREVAPFIARALKGEHVQFERLAEMPGLGRRWLAATYTPVLDAGGHPDGWVTIAIDIHDRKLAEEALKAADRRKDEFLATLAHELRNPLAPIRNAVAILGRKGPLDPELTWSREVIVRQVEQMSRLIDDLLDIERISRGKFLVRKERIELESAIDMALEISRPYITAAGHRLSVLMPSERVTLEADPARLAQVFSNLLNNAAKFTDPHGTISLSATLEGLSVVVSVEDSGIGFSAETATRLFKPYTQLTDSHERSRGGLGIGLSLVQGIVALHGGIVEARSAGQGQGAEFIVRLPIAAPGENVQGKERPAAGVVPSPGSRVLIADDNKDAADSLQRILAHYGYEVRVAYDGDAAVELGLAFAPQIAVLDIGMPGANGYEVARKMRERYDKRVTLVALTGWGQEGDRRRALDAGFDYHLTKPVDPSVLNDLLIQVAADADTNTDTSANAA